MLWVNLSSGDSHTCDSAPPSLSTPAPDIRCPKEEPVPEVVQEAPPQAALLPPLSTTISALGVDTLASLLRHRIGWVVGVVLTIVGSIYVAGTVWDDLSIGWRQALAASCLAAYARGSMKAAA